VFLTGAVERLGDFKGQVERGLGLPVTLASPFQGCEVSETAHTILEHLPEVSFASLVGLASDPGEIDLTPQTTKLRLAFETKAKTLVLLGCQCLAALILVSMLLFGRAQKEERYYRMLRAVYEKSAREALEVEGSLKQLQFVENQLRQQNQLLRAVSAVAKLSPPEIKWTSLTFTQGEAIVLGGVADQLPKVYEFSGAIARTPNFGNVEARRVSKRKEGDRDVTDFELRCPLVSNKRAP
jgi:hypothetical protein